ncbi:class I SAM-dependent methyltransferase [Nocardia rhizosphaerihabitans]|uniref:Methyltransferase type 12 n=1 Tax=Nocardia rhizosphaerihabitans TaxID=1691570 RepID=A0ABQ2K3M6_9NOCA|nr:methyltransferase domain-containing protein [Nocardia rhizosphaerihabitans]GGN67741.1 methyltransferase type 12 [Nocardia rhizosphaerihabitans]
MTDAQPSADRRLAAQALAANDPTGWFEPLYAEAAACGAVVPWDRAEPNPLLVDWLTSASIPQGARGLVIGCGYGTDAEFVAARGIRTTAFDISPTAIRGARARFPQSPVTYKVADLLHPPEAWLGAFDLVIESITVQSLPPEIRRAAVTSIQNLLARDATLLVIADIATAPALGPPWPLTADDIGAFTAPDLTPVRIQCLPRPDAPGRHRWRAEFHRPAS